MNFIPERKRTENILTKIEDSEEVQALEQEFLIVLYYQCPFKESNPILSDHINQSRMQSTGS